MRITNSWSHASKGAEELTAASIRSFECRSSDPARSLVGGSRLSAPIRAFAGTPDGGGYWLVAANGGIFNFGDAGFYGSLSSKGVTSSSVVSMAATPDGKGYWLIDSSGDVWAFGDANSTLGSLSGDGILNIVGVAVTPDGAGYWLVGSDGSVSKFGDAS